MREMKDSGIPWIGEIPAGWQLGKAKYFIGISNGSDPITEGEIPVYGSGTTSFKTCGEKKNPPTVLIGRKGSVDTPRYIDHPYWNVDTAFDVKSKDGFSLKYYYYLAICFDYKFYISQTTLPSMTQTNYSNMIIPLPPLSEQHAIAEFLDATCAEIDAAIAHAQALRDKLDAYRKSLIFAYVTGKREVAA